MARRAVLPEPENATRADIAEAQRRYELTFLALSNADHLSPVEAYQRQLTRLREWLIEAGARPKLP